MVTVKKTVIKLTVFCCTGIFQSQGINFTNQQTSVATGSSSPGNQGKSVGDFEVHVYVPYLTLFSPLSLLNTLLIYATMPSLLNTLLHHFCQ